MTCAVIATVGANVDRDRLRVAGETLLPMFAAGAKPEVVKLRAEGITANPNTGANVDVVRLAVAGVTVTLSLTLIVGANVVVESDAVPGTTSLGKTGANDVIESVAVSGMTLSANDGANVVVVRVALAGLTIT